MTYDPFARGRYPVGVRSDEWTDSSRDRTLPVEIWYPADDRFAGQDVDPQTWDLFTPGWVAEGHATADELAHQAAVRNASWGDVVDAPLVLLVHGWAGYRREATFIGTHLASHGYVVVSPDVGLSTYAEVDAFLTEQEPRGNPADLVAHSQAIAEARRKDVPFLIDSATRTLPVRPDGVGVTGASFGGWTSLIAPAVDPRVSAVVPMCPAGGPAPTGNVNGFGHLESSVWLSDAATLIVAADRDSLLPLYGQLALLRNTPATWKRMVTLANADHNHFVDDIDTGQAWLKEYAERVAAIFPDGPGDWPLIARSIGPIEELLPGALAQDALRGLVTAHFDAFLRGDDSARALVCGDIDALLNGRDIDTYTIELAPITSSS